MSSTVTSTQRDAADARRSTRAPGAGRGPEPRSGRAGEQQRGPLIDRHELRRVTRPLVPMGQQPALDGIRAISVALVILYHAGFSTVHGGFFGVEVFFVVSGYLITTLLWEERARDGAVSLRQFWLRRARRLLPALLLVVGVCTAWAVLFAQQHLELLRRDVLPALLYVGNWGQIFGDVPYFSPADPVLRHVWSLAVEEQWYLLWPLLFVVLMRATRSHPRRMAAVLGGAALAIAVWSASVASSTAPTVAVGGQDPDRFNFLYLNTLTRSSGLLLGAALAFVWRPWASAHAATPRRRTQPAARRPTSSATSATSAPSTTSASSTTSVAPRSALEPGRVADVAAVGAVLAIVLISVTRGSGALSHPSLYRAWLPLVTVLSAVAVAAAVHPGARVARSVFGGHAIAAVGQRSYGLYLWHWPVFVFAGVRADHARFLPAMLITVGVSELSFRLVETPIRRGALGRWWQRTAARPAEDRRRIVGTTAAVSAAAVLALAIPVIAHDPTDPALDTSDVRFDAAPLPAGAASTGGEAATGTAATGTGAAQAPVTASDASDASDAAPGSAGATPAPSAVSQPSATAAGAAPGGSVAAAAPVATAPLLPRPVVVVGDSQAHSLAINLPSGIESTFTVADGSLDGCGVLDAGNVVSRRSSFRRSFTDCAGWQREWAASVRSSGAPLALVVLGAWDVFDVRLGDVVVPFGSAEFDAMFRRQLQTGIDALSAEGAHVALLEVPCMRPVDVEGAGVPALPERGDDARVAHLNELLREVAAANAGAATFVDGPNAWCDDPAISTDLGHRWDGVHVYKPGAKLIFETIAPALLAIPL